MRRLILAIQFLTRIPTPQVKNFTPQLLAESSIWFPLVGLMIGALVALPVLLNVDHRLAALLALVIWVWVTGGLHLDGLADLSDALGAAHRNRDRFLAVLSDPHIGSFGAISLIVQILAKYVLLLLLFESSVAAFVALPLIAAWARLGPLIWSQTLPSLKTGTAEPFTWHVSRLSGIGWMLILIAGSWVIHAMWLGPIVIFLWWLFLRLRLNGMTGDCLGAGIEFSEAALLLAAVVWRQ